MTWSASRQKNCSRGRSTWIFLASDCLAGTCVTSQV
jgi:hypothetical protein